MALWPSETIVVTAAMPMTTHRTVSPGPELVAAEGPKGDGDGEEEVHSSRSGQDVTRRRPVSRRRHTLSLKEQVVPVERPFPLGYSTQSRKGISGRRAGRRGFPSSAARIRFVNYYFTIPKNCACRGVPAAP